MVSPFLEFLCIERTAFRSASIFPSIHLSISIHPTYGSIDDSTFSQLFSQYLLTILSPSLRPLSHSTSSIRNVYTHLSCCPTNRQKRSLINSRLQFLLLFHLPIRTSLTFAVFTHSFTHSLIHSSFTLPD